jgi:nucleoside-diphosphate-sugar epimerase
MKTKYIVFGSGSGVGLEFVKKLRMEGKTVYALIRSEKYIETMIQLGVHFVRGDIMKKEDVSKIFQEATANGKNIPMVVVSTVGGKPKDGGERSDYLGNLHIFDIANLHNTQRVLLVTSIGCGSMMKNMSENTIRVIGDALVSKTKAEDYLRSTHLPYTILRPGGLVSEPATGKAEILEGDDIHGMITREDVAILMNKSLADNSTVGKTLCLVDRTL